MVRTLTFTLLALLLGACGQAPAPPVRLQAAGDPAELAAYKTLIAEYERQNPGEKIELIPVGKQKDHMAKLATRFAAGDPPDLFMINFRRYGQFAEKGVLAPLGARLTARGAFKPEDFFAPALEAFQWKDELLCIPQNVSSLVMYYNRTLFKQAGVEFPKAEWTMTEMVNVATRLTPAASGGADNGIYGLGIEPSLIRVAPFIWTFGGDLVNDLHRPSLIELERGSAPLALEFIKRLRTMHQVTPPLALVKAEDLESRFARGALGMILQSRRYTATLRALKNPPDWDVASFPRMSPAKPSQSALHADGYCMARDAKNAEGAEKFVAYAISAEGQTLLAGSGRTVPSRKSVAQSPVFLDPKLPPEHAQVFLDAIPNLRRTPSVAVWNEVETKADQVMEECYYEAPVPSMGYVEGAGGAQGMRCASWIRGETQDVLVRGMKESNARR